MKGWSAPMTDPSDQLRDAAAQTDQILADLARSLRNAGSGLDDVCKITVFITDRAHRSAVYPVIGKYFRGIHPVSTGIILPGFDRPGTLVKIDAEAVPKHAGQPHRRLRKYHSSTARYGTQQQPLDCDFCMAVRAGARVFLRGQTGVDLNEVFHGRGDAVAQARQAMDNVAILLAEAGARLSDVVKVTVFVTDRAFLAGVSEAVLGRFEGAAPAFAAMIVKGLASPELLMEVDVTAIVAEQRA
jgi:enamine deaminase RidA (YjgF/YER057c/UK114 family)